MKQKTRYNVRLASRKGVTVRQGAFSDLDTLYRMYAETSVRDGFVIRQPDYYRTVWETFLDHGQAEVLIAEVDGSPVAAVIAFCFSGRAWFVYGMSRELHREKMPAYLLQWEAMQRLKGRGVRIYDLWGAPDNFTAADPLWGVYRFKQGLGGQVVRTIGAWDYPLRPGIYRIYTRFFPRFMALLRYRGMTRTHAGLS
jgi:lipid II:glycine glycyltransferase (peptidoglycan interpeptide bridge formation enzyme)